MSRSPGSNGEKTLKAIYDAAIELIYQNGFEAVSLRQLAGAVGLQAGSLYNHIASKQDLLYRLTLSIMLELNTALDQQLRGVEDPEEALRIFIRFHITHYTARKKQVFIGNSELRSLTGDHYKQIVLLRDQYEKRLVEILESGAAKDCWAKADMRVSAKALISMLTGVCVWYDPKGDYTIDQLVDQYSGLVFNGINHSVSDCRA